MFKLWRESIYEIWKKSDKNDHVRVTTKVDGQMRWMGLQMQGQTDNQTQAENNIAPPKFAGGAFIKLNVAVCLLILDARSSVSLFVFP